MPLSSWNSSARRDFERWRYIHAKSLQDKQKRAQSGDESGKKAFAGCARLLGEVGEEAIEAENVEHAGKIVTERHQAPFAADLVEAADQEVLIAGTAFE